MSFSLLLAHSLPTPEGVNARCTITNIREKSIEIFEVDDLSNPSSISEGKDFEVLVRPMNISRQPVYELSCSEKIEQRCLEYLSNNLYSIGDEIFIVDLYPDCTIWDILLSDFKEDLFYGFNYLISTTDYDSDILNLIRFGVKQDTIKSNSKLRTQVITILDSIGQ